MCGYVRRDYSASDIPAFMRRMGMPDLLQAPPPKDTPIHFYPAFGGAASRIIPDLIVNKGDSLATVDATWWFDCHEDDTGNIVVGDRTTFNARNLKSNFWKGAIRHHRALVIATAIGEGKNIDGKVVHFLAEGTTPLILGAVVRQFPSGGC